MVQGLQFKFSTKEKHRKRKIETQSTIVEGSVTTFPDEWILVRRTGGCNHIQKNRNVPSDFNDCQANSRTTKSNRTIEIKND